MLPGKTALTISTLCCTYIHELQHQLSTSSRKSLKIATIMFATNRNFIQWQERWSCGADAPPGKGKVIIYQVRVASSDPALLIAYRPQNNILGHWAATSGASPAWSELSVSFWPIHVTQVSDQAAPPGWCQPWHLEALATSTRSSFKGGGSCCTNLISAEMWKRKHQYLLGKTRTCSWEKPCCIRVRTLSLLAQVDFYDPSGKVADKGFVLTFPSERFTKQPPPTPSSPLR